MLILQEVEPNPHRQGRSTRNRIHNHQNDDGAEPSAQQESNQLFSVVYALRRRWQNIPLLCVIHNRSTGIVEMLGPACSSR
jgi:hypothetical protein